MIATSASVLPVGPEWSYEVKWDGYRALLVADGRGARLISRNGKDLTAAYPQIVIAAPNVTAQQMILDGEIVALDLW